MSQSINVSKGKHGLIRLGIYNATIDIPDSERVSLVRWLNKSLDFGESKWSFRDDRNSELQLHARGSLIEIYIQAGDGEQVFTKTATLQREGRHQLASAIEWAEHGYSLP